MEIGFVGLGRMGLNMVKRILQGDHTVVAYDINEEARKEAETSGARTASSLKELVNRLKPPRAVWVMVPSGAITEETMAALSALLDKDDIIIDGGNSKYTDSIATGEKLVRQGIRFLDAGTSGGIWGLTVGYCLMVGGDETAFRRIEPVIKTLAPPDGYSHVGPSGAGHFVKMVHNGIEYAMLQSYAEGFEILKAKKEFGLDLGAISHLWNQGSVVRSWLLELAEDAFARDTGLDAIRGYVEDSGEGRWTIEAAIGLDIPAPTITQALFERFRSRQEESFANKFIAALRNEFGGHKVIKK